ncbi:MAG: flagellar hook protein FlgE [Alphaproteobacteria bacterium]|nr:flagellar hook protein FlgE [Alphaproteobacteria bacterium]
MSLYGALYTGVAGLSANSRAMANTSTNIANVNTVGYKSTRNEFSTLLSTTTIGSYTGGVKNVSVPQISTQGNLLQTSSPTDLAISGQGFFTVTSAPTENPGVNEIVYTRAGAFQKDASGYLRNASGYYLQGWALDVNGDIPTNANDVSIINLGQVNGTALPTTEADLRINLQSTAAVTSPYVAGDIAAGTVIPQFETSIEIFDSQGGSRPMSLAFIKSAANTWQYEAIYEGDPADIGGAGNNPIATGTVTFNTDGTIATPAAAVSITIPFVAASGLSAQAIDFDMGTPGLANGFTQFDTVSTLYASDINGTLYGGLSGVRVDENGFVIALFTNGIETPLYKLPVATFLNADGLGPLNGNAYRTSVESGPASFKAADQAGAGKISNLAVEQSTVDIAKEFSDMIVIQRAYSAASKIITTADEMLDELTRLKR